MSIRVESVEWLDPAAVTLREAMTAELLVRYADRLGDGLTVEADTIVHTAVAYAADGSPVGHAALRRNGDDLELKRMYVTPESRGTGVAAVLLAAVERAAAGLGAQRLILHTGDRQPDAVRLYVKSGYTPIPVFPPYDDVHSSCFQKPLTPAAPSNPARRPDPTR